MESTAQRRLKAIQGHLVPITHVLDSHVQTSTTASEFFHSTFSLSSGKHIGLKSLTPSLGPPGTIGVNLLTHTQGYSVVLPEKLNTGKWNVYRSVRSPLKLISRLPEHPEIGTLHDNFMHAIEAFKDYNYLGTRVRGDGTVGEYKWMTYGEAGTVRLAIGSGLRHHGLLEPCYGHLQLGGLHWTLFINRPEWLIVDHACSAYSYISVPLYDTLGPDAVKYIVNHADVQAISVCHTH
ncbi:Long chain acyl-CoA synthetase 6, peroxisomal [Vitis vinifera]|uniref:Long chain acyl-CoA synthetase 6, peroxisomal n=1 Tax=Vitis vinifera TaxID=29760 RepID=A0A438KCP2_VITVI|nr:Long chain acyl-CoA synthetase 6, peroxisomal [Vitis vinifera]